MLIMPKLDQESTASASFIPPKEENAKPTVCAMSLLISISLEDVMENPIAREMFLKYSSTDAPNDSTLNDRVCDTCLIMLIRYDEPRVKATVCDMLLLISCSLEVERENERGWLIDLDSSIILLVLREKVIVWLIVFSYSLDAGV
jgi:hypothetical protein